MTECDVTLKGWATLLILFIVCLPFMVYSFMEDRWLLVFPMVLSSLQVLGLLLIALCLFYRTREGEATMVSATLTKEHKPTSKDPEEER